MVSRLIKNMAKGDREAVLNGILNAGTSDKVCGIYFAVIHKMRDKSNFTFSDDLL